jgi:hypothetical protein
MVMSVDLMQATLQICRQRRDENSTGLEHAARAALSSGLGRDLTDVEWRRARARVLEFVTILRAWDRKALTGEAEVDKAA